jgi:hypothetical protein
MDFMETGVTDMQQTERTGTKSKDYPGLEHIALSLDSGRITAQTFAVLADLDPDQLDEPELLESLVVVDRHKRRLEALAVKTLAKLHGLAARDGELDRSAMQEEIACALRLSSNTAAHRIRQAVTLAKRHPRTLRQLESGTIHYTQAVAVGEATNYLGEDQDAARCIETLVLARMPGQTVATTRAALRRAVHKVDPDGAEQRHEHAKKQRAVRMQPEEDGMATLRWHTTAELLVAAMEHIDEHARPRDATDHRTLDQRRADTLAHLIMRGATARTSTSTGTVADGPPAASSETAHPDAGPAALVNVTVSLETLLGLNQDPADLHRYGPVTATTARALATAPGSLWRWLAYDSVSGALIKTSPTTYRPTAETRRHVQLRDRICAFPGCRMPAIGWCDLDHVSSFNQEYPELGGLTTPDNLIPLCRHHHRLKTARLWRTDRDTSNNTITWTAKRTGNVYQHRHSHDYSDAA